MTLKQAALLKRLKKNPRFNKDSFHQWADYIEFLCVVNKDTLLSRKDFIDRLTNEGRTYKKGALVKEEDHDAEEDVDDEEEEVEVVADDHDIVLGRNGRLEMHSINYFRQIKFRSVEFGDYYPFILSDDEQSITLKNDLTLENKVYLMLIYCSQLGICFDYKPELTGYFESLCLEVMKSMLPVDSECHLFGSSNADGTALSKSQLFDKLKYLAEKINEPIKIKQEQLSVHDRGDGGLDVYGFVKMGDSLAHTAIFFGQCACTPQWRSKQASAKFDRWNGMINLSVRPIPFIFIPYSFRQSNGEWHKYHYIEMTVMVDRKRIIHHFHNKLEKFETIASLPIIEEIIAIKEEII